MRFVSWNVNGLRACVQKGFLDFFHSCDADFFCVQETKLQPDQINLSLEGYEQYWHSAVKKGYSGTAIFTRQTPLSVKTDMGIPEHDGEGRILTLSFPAFYLVDVYSPNSKRDLSRIPYRMEWEDAFREYVSGLDKEKPVVICGDMNVAHQEIDLKNPASNHNTHGFTDQERSKMSSLLDAGFIDTFRYLYPDKKDAYSWWSYMYNARANNAGWRIDYFLVSDRWKDRIQESRIYTQIQGSDHCPVGLDLDI